MGATNSKAAMLRDMIDYDSKDQSIVSLRSSRAIKAADIRRLILEQSKRANVGHIGSALSIVDILTVLYGYILKVQSPENLIRDRFILSKGHAALALYAAIFLKGWITIEELNQYCSDHSLLGVHPEHELRGVDFSTGSLGQGLSIAAGAALAARLQKSPRRIYVLLSDAECNEGSTWEAVMFAAHYKLSNLIAIIDLNGQQALGYTEDVIRLSPMGERWKAFGWEVIDVDGHDIEEMVQTIGNLDTTQSSPHVIVAHTVFGKGVSFMENQIKWHYLPMSDEEYRNAISEIDKIE